MGETVVIKGVEEDAYRELKSRAAKDGIRIGQAASLAFKAWASGERQQRIRDADRMKAASDVMDSNRSKLKPLRDWSSTEVVKRWRKTRRTSS